MLPHLQYIAVCAIVGSGVLSGLLFAFSLVVMRALRELEPEVGMFAMQRINVLIVGPLFLAVFLGTAVLCAVLVVVGWRGLPSTGALLLMLGGVAYLVGPLGVTVAFNVPLNNELAATSKDQAAVVWPGYVSAWLRWNHIRTGLGVVGTVLLACALPLTSQVQ